MKRTLGLSAVTFVVFAMLCSPVLAADNTIRFGGAGYVVLDLFSDSDDGYGAFVDYERMITERIGLDLAVQWAHYDIEVDFTLNGERIKADLGSVDMVPVTVSPNFHLTPGKTVDFYIRPSVGFAYLTSNDADDSTTELAYGAGFGLDVGGEKWIFVAGADWLSVDSDSDLEGGNFDNAVVRAGLGIRF